MIKEKALKNYTKKVQIYDAKPQKINIKCIKANKTIVKQLNFKTNIYEKQIESKPKIREELSNIRKVVNFYGFENDSFEEPLFNVPTQFKEFNSFETTVKLLGGTINSYFDEFYQVKYYIHFGFEYINTGIIEYVKNLLYSFNIPYENPYLIDIVVYESDLQRLYDPENKLKANPIIKEIKKDCIDKDGSKILDKCIKYTKMFKQAFCIDNARKYALEFSKRFVNIIVKNDQIYELAIRFDKLSLDDKCYLAQMIVDKMSSIYNAPTVTVVFTQLQKKEVAIASLLENKKLIITISEEFLKKADFDSFIKVLMHEYNHCLDFSYKGFLTERQSFIADICYVSPLDDIESYENNLLEIMSRFIEEAATINCKPYGTILNQIQVCKKTREIQFKNRLFERYKMNEKQNIK